MTDTSELGAYRAQVKSGRTLGFWLEGHRQYFARRSKVLGMPFDENESEVLFERFEVVHRAS